MMEVPEKPIMTEFSGQKKRHRQEFNQWFARFMQYPTTRSCAERDIFRDLKDEIYEKWLKHEKGVT